MKLDALDNWLSNDIKASRSDNKAFHKGQDPFLPKARLTRSKSMPTVLNTDPPISNPAAETGDNTPQQLEVSISPTPIKLKDTSSTKTPPEATVPTLTKETTKISSWIYPETTRPLPNATKIWKDKFNNDNSGGPGIYSGKLQSTFRCSMSPMHSRSCNLLMELWNNKPGWWKRKT